MIAVIKKLVRNLCPADYLDAIGPLFLVLLFSGVLIAISSGQETMVRLTMGLIAWPIYQFIGFLVENSIMNFLLARKTGKEHDYMMAVGASILLIGVLSFFNYSHWVLVVVSVQMLPLLFHPPAAWDQEQGCVNAFV